MAKQLEGRVNETVLKSYLGSIGRQTGDSLDDVRARLVNAQLWLARIAQGDTSALKLDASEFAKARGVDPRAIGIVDPFQSETSPAPQKSDSNVVQYSISELKNAGYSDNDIAALKLQGKVK